MKTIGFIGGMSWESSAQYYRIANQAVRDHVGGCHSACCAASAHEVPVQPRDESLPRLVALRRRPCASRAGTTFDFLLAQALRRAMITMHE